jgi:hypothetical protein
MNTSHKVVAIVVLAAFLFLPVAVGAQPADKPPAKGAKAAAIPKKAAKAPAKEAAKAPAKEAAKAPAKEEAKAPGKEEGKPTPKINHVVKKEIPVKEAALRRHKVTAEGLQTVAKEMRRTRATRRQETQEKLAKVLGKKYKLPGVHKELRRYAWQRARLGRMLTIMTTGEDPAMVKLVKQLIVKAETIHARNLKAILGGK